MAFVKKSVDLLVHLEVFHEKYQAWIQGEAPATRKVPDAGRRVRANAIPRGVEQMAS
jgi:hypothetical protein